MGSVLRSAACAVLLSITVIPAHAGMATLLGKAYNRSVEYAAMSVAAYPYVNALYEGVLINESSVPVQMPVAVFIQYASRAELIDFITQTGSPYIQHAALLVLGGYVLKKTVNCIVN